MSASAVPELVKSAPLFSEKLSLDQLDLQTLADNLQEILLENFKEVKVTVVDCPDLTHPEWGLSAKGLKGSPRLLDIGGVPNLSDPDYNNLAFALKDIAASAELPEGFYFGAASGDAVFVGQNSELMPSEHLKTSKRDSQVAYIPVTGTEQKEDQPAFVMKHYDWHKVGFLGNLYGSDGESGKVLEIRVKQRTGQKNFVTCMREGLKARFPDKLIGLGGVFRLAEGKFKAHIMPQFLGRFMEDSPSDAGKWLKFYEFGPGATFLSWLLSGSPPESMHVRVEHTHFFNKTTGEGGHYHHDTTPAEAEYLGYYHPAEVFYRIEDAFDRSKTKKASAL